MSEKTNTDDKSHNDGFMTWAEMERRWKRGTPTPEAIARARAELEAVRAKIQAKAAK